MIGAAALRAGGPGSLGVAARRGAHGHGSESKSIEPFFSTYRTKVVL